MTPAPVARRYARALFHLAEEQGIVDPVRRALGTIAEALADPQAARALTGPIPRLRKSELLRGVAEGVQAPPALRDFLRLLAERDRLAHLGAIRAVFDDLVDRRDGVTRMTVRSAATLPDDVLAELARVFGTITGKRALASVEVDPELIAGVIVEVDGRVYDGSLRTQLAKLHRQMASGG
jgi:F-type H+-transporting ATPase subunit delta